MQRSTSCTELPNTPALTSHMLPALDVRRSPQRASRLPTPTHRPLVYAFAALVIVASPSAALADEPVDRFLAALEKNAAVPAEARRLVQKTWADCKSCDPSEFLTQGLAVLSPKFREGLEAYDAEDLARCAAVMGDLRADRDPFVGAHAAVYEAKSLVAMERFPEALARLETLSTEATLSDAANAVDITGFSYFTAEVEFLRGVALLADLQYERAATILRRLLEKYPDASPRLTVAAQQMLTELAQREPEQIGEVVDLMTYSARRLDQGSSDQPLQEKQKRILDLLDVLIEEAKQREQSGGGGGGGGGGGSGNQGGQSPSNPMQDSMLPGGQAKDGHLRESRRASPGEMWGAMPPAERERVLQALRESFPARYRKLVEQYYEEMAKKP